MNSNVSLELKVALAAAKHGAEVVASAFRDGGAAVQKTVGTEKQGLVTQADLDSEQVIVATIRDAFPDHNFLGEESFSDDINSEDLWVIDPLDGTNNFAHGIPHFGVSVAYYRNGIGICGVIVNPISGDCFWSEQGRGAFVNETKCQVNDHDQLSQTMIATGFYYDRGEMMQQTLDVIRKLFHKNIQGIRRFGAAALDLVHVGCGQYGGFFELTLSPWDFAAARIFIEEAGGKVTDENGRNLTLKKSPVVASNGRLHAELLEIVKQDH